MDRLSTLLLPSHKSSQTTLKDSSNASTPVLRAKKAVIVSGCVTLDMVLRNEVAAPLDLESFREYLLERFAEENLNFILYIQNDFTTIHSPNDYEAHVSYLVTTFCKRNSPQELNIPFKLRSAIMKCYKDKIDLAKETEEMDLMIFDELYRHIYRILQTDVFPPFKNKVVSRQQIYLSQRIALWWKQRPLPSLSEFFSFPNPVIELESRIHFQLGLFWSVLGFLLYYFLKIPWIFAFTTYGHLARMLCGPRLDLQAFLVLFVIAPIVRRYFDITESYEPGPPRRFTQVVALFMSAAVYVLFTLNLNLPGYIICGMYIFAMALAALLNFCLGCFIFEILMKMGCIPKSVCESCRIHYFAFKECPHAKAAMEQLV